MKSIIDPHYIKHAKKIYYFSSIHARRFHLKYSMQHDDWNLKFGHASSSNGDQLPNDIPLALNCASTNEDKVVIHISNCTRKYSTTNSSSIRYFHTSQQVSQKTFRSAHREISSENDSMDKNESCLQTPKQIVLEWIKSKKQEQESKQEVIAPTRSEWQFLIQRTGMRKNTIAKLIRYYETPPGKVTSQVKQYIFDWVNHRSPIGSEKENNIQRCSKDQLAKVSGDQDTALNNLNTVNTVNDSKTTQNRYHLTQDELNALMKATGLNPTQIRRIIRNATESGNAFSEEKKMILLDWISEHQALPTKEQLKHLKGLTQLSALQIQQFLKYRLLPKVNLQEEDEIYIRELIQRENPVSSETKMQIRDKYSMTSKQLSDLIRKYKNPIGEITPTSREIIQKYALNQEKLSNDDILQLQLSTQLNRTQILYLFRVFKDVKGEFTPHKKQLLKNWFEEHQFRKPTNEELRTLKARFILNEDQILSLYKRIMRKRNSKPIQVDGVN